MRLPNSLCYRLGEALILARIGALDHDSYEWFGA
jgi:hypothetical protein